MKGVQLTMPGGIAIQSGYLYLTSCRIRTTPCGITFLDAGTGAMSAVQNAEDDAARYYEHMCGLMDAVSEGESAAKC